METNEQKAGFEYYKNNFPSDTFLELLVGTRAEHTRRTVFRKNLELLVRGPFAVYQSDIALMHALDRGELRKSRNIFRWLRAFPYCIDSHIYARTHDPYHELRTFFDEAIRGFAMAQMRMQELCDLEPRRLYLFREGTYGEAVNIASLPQHEISASMLAEEFAEALRISALHTDDWWQYGVEGSSTVYLEPLPNATDLLMKKKKLRESKSPRGAFKSCWLPQGD